MDLERHIPVTRGKDDLHTISIIVTKKLAKEKNGLIWRIEVTFKTSCNFQDRTIFSIDAVDDYG